MVIYREVCPEGVQNKCPGGGVWCRGFMSWGDTLILVISRGVQLYYGIAQYYFIILFRYIRNASKLFKALQFDIIVLLCTIDNQRV